MKRVMPEPWQTDAESAVALLWVLLLVRQIDRRTDRDQRELLADFQFAAWPSFKARDQ